MPARSRGTSAGASYRREDGFAGVGPPRLALRGARHRVSRDGAAGPGGLPGRAGGCGPGGGTAPTPGMVWGCRRRGVPGVGRCRGAGASLIPLCFLPSRADKRFLPWAEPCRWGYSVAAGIWGTGEQQGRATSRGVAPPLPWNPLPSCKPPARARSPSAEAKASGSGGGGHPTAGLTCWVLRVFSCLWFRHP